VGPIHVIGRSWKMLNQPPVSPLNLAMTEMKIVAIKCQILTLKCTKSFVGWGFAPNPRIVYILSTYIFDVIGPCPPTTKSFLGPCPPLCLAVSTLSFKRLTFGLDLLHVCGPLPQFAGD